MKPEENQFEKGVIAMARNTLPVAELLRRGEWGAGDIELWLKAVINQDSDYLDNINSRIHSTVKGEVES